MRDAAGSPGKGPREGLRHLETSEHRSLGEAGSKIQPGNGMTGGSHIRVSRAEEAQKELSSS